MKIIAYLERPARVVEDFQSADVIRRVDGRTVVGFEVGWIATLAHNLAIGGGLCLAFHLGEECIRECEYGDYQKAWSPGLGRPWTPGEEPVCLL